MKILEVASKSLAEASPLTLLLVGVGAWLVFPSLKKGLRTTAVAATKGVIGVTDSVTKFANNVSEGISDVVAEAGSMSTGSAVAAPAVGAALGGAVGAGVGGAIANSLGATVGAGLGGAIGANVAEKDNNSSKSHSGSDEIISLENPVEQPSHENSTKPNKKS